MRWNEMACAAVLLLALPAAAQNSATTAPPAGKPATPAPAATAGAPAASSAAPAAGAPSTTPSTAAPAAGKKVTIRVPTGGQYQAYIEESPTTAPVTVTETAPLDLPSGLAEVTLVVMDQKSGYAARRKVTAASAGEQSFASPDFTLIQKVQVRVTGKASKPIASGIVVLTDFAKGIQRKTLTDASLGVAEFDFVAGGAGQLVVTPQGGSSTNKSVTVGLAPGSSVQVIEVALPEVTAVLDVPAAAPGSAPGTAPSSTPAAAPVPSAPTPTAPAPAPAQRSGDFGSTLISFIVLGALVYCGYNYCRKNNIKLEDVLKKLGVQPEAVVQGGGSLAGANLATGPVSPGVPPPPPPIVADPNQCPYCGQMKDASGGCACSALPGRGPAPTAGSATGSGPRLVGMAGVYLGQVFPINGAVVMGRDPANPVALDRDGTTSRRHAQITAMGGSYQLQDLNSANGTFVNGARVTEVSLSPGDEITVGGTRFRFEA